MSRLNRNEHTQQKRSFLNLKKNQKALLKEKWTQDSLENIPQEFIYERQCSKLSFNMNDGSPAKRSMFYNDHEITFYHGRHFVLFDIIYSLDKNEPQYRTFLCGDLATQNIQILAEQRLTEKQHQLTPKESIPIIFDARRIAESYVLRERCVIRKINEFFSTPLSDDVLTTRLDTPKRNHLTIQQNIFNDHHTEHEKITALLNLRNRDIF